MIHPAIQFSKVSKKYSATEVLHEIDFEVGSGSFLGLTGLNGAGKTTLIKCLLDFCEVDSGSIQIQGIDVRRPASRKRLSYLPERFMAPYFLTGREFVRSMVSLSGCHYDENKTCAMFEALDLDRISLDKPVRSYSKGMNQKVGLAACFLSQRDLYVLDEPMSGLDPKARAGLKEMLGKLKSEGCTVFLTSHSLSDIDEICDKIAVLHKGALAYSGALDEFRSRYDEKTLEHAFLKCIGD
jgi:ABC-2 type transport system ATP-binding protein